MESFGKSGFLLTNGIDKINIFYRNKYFKMVWCSCSGEGIYYTIYVLYVISSFGAFFYCVIDEWEQ